MRLIQKHTKDTEMKLPVLPADKSMHVIYGAAVSLVFQWIGTLIVAQGVQTFVSPKELGALASAVFGIAKELLDRELNARAMARGEKPPHSVELTDFLATVVGGVVVALAP